MGTISKAEVTERVTELDVNTLAQYDVTYERITYRTQYMGKPIDSHGLLILPKGSAQSLPAYVLPRHRATFGKAKRRKNHPIPVRWRQGRL